MSREFYKKIQELKGIKEEVSEDFNISACEEKEEYKPRDINYPKQRKFRAATVKKGIIIVVAVVCLATGLSSIPIIQNNITIVEAKSKKDKKKPKIKFSGKSKITVEKNKSVKIPKTTAKDNVDGNVTNKLKITVKKGGKSYSKIAKAIKNNKKTKFTETGKYEVIYTVKDKAGNKATKKRYITVVDSKKETTENVTTERPTTENATTQEETTEKITTEQYTTEEAVTEKPTPQKPAVDKPTMPDMSEYGTMEKVTVNNVDYNILKVADTEKYSDEIYSSEQIGKFSSDKILASHIGFDSSICDYSKNHKYLEFFGNLKVVDRYGVDCSDNIFIVEHLNIIRFYYINSKGEFKLIINCILTSYDFVKESGNYTYIDYENKICINGEIFGEEFL